MSAAQNLINQGRQYHSEGAMQMALHHYQQAYELRPQDAELNSLIGQALMHQGEGSAALQFFDRAIMYAPANLAHRFNMGRALISLGDYQKALPYCQEASQLDKRSPLAWADLGCCQLQLNQLEDAIKSLKKSLKLDEKQYDAWTNLGICYLETEQFHDATRAFFQADKLYPNYSSKFNLAKLNQAKQNQDAFETAVQQAASFARLNIQQLSELLDEKQLAISNKKLRGNLLGLMSEAHYHQRNVNEAVAYAQLAFEADPTSFNHVLRLATFLSDLGEYQKAQEKFDLAFTMLPDFPESEANLRFRYSIQLKDQNKLTDAHEQLLQAAKCDPNNPQIHYCIAVSHQLMGNPVEADAQLDDVIARFPDHPDTQYEKGLMDLMNKRFARAWPNYLARTRLDTHLNYLPHPITGEALPKPRFGKVEALKGKKLCILKEQGLGDEIFFLRFAPVLKDKGVDISLLTDSRIANMLRRTDLFSDVYHAETFTLDASQKFDAYIGEGDLPLLCGHGELIDTPDPLSLKPDEEWLDKFEKQFNAAGQGPYWGITWEAGQVRQAGIASSLHKRIPPKDFIDCLENLPGTLVVLQRNPSEKDIEFIQQNASQPLLDLSRENSNLDAMLAICSLLDHYIGVSNTNMHLSASLGGKASVLVPHPAEWRWLISGEISPWFPEFKIYRQEANKSWSAALESLSNDLAHQNQSVAT